MPRPTVAIVCPREFKFTDHEASVERPVLGDVAELTTVWLDFNAPFPAEVLGADAIILWHGPRVTAEVVAGMTRCRAIVRNGVGFDSVDLAAAARAGGAPARRPPLSIAINCRTAAAARKSLRPPQPPRSAPPPLSRPTAS